MSWYCPDRSIGEAGESATGELGVGACREHAETSVASEIRNSPRQRHPWGD
jgi:hypothetical protein